MPSTFSRAEKSVNHRAKLVGCTEANDGSNTTVFVLPFTVELPFHPGVSPDAVTAVPLHRAVMVRASAAPSGVKVPPSASVASLQVK